MQGHVFLQIALLSFCRGIWKAVSWILRTALGTKASKDRAEDGAKRETFKDIPGPTALPFFGTVFTSGSKKDLIKHSKAHLSKYGPLVREEWYWNYPLIIVYDPHDIETVFSNTKYIRPGVEIMRKHRKKVPEGTKCFRGGMANANGQQWRDFRMASKSIQNAKFLDAFIPNGNKIADDLVGIMHEGGPYIEDFLVFITRTAVENNFQLCFGRKVGILVKEEINRDPQIRQFETDMKMFWESINESIKGYPWWKHFNTSTLKKYTKSEASLYKFIRESAQSDYFDGLSWWIMQSEHLHSSEQYDALFEYCVATQSTASTLHIMFQLIASDNRIQDKLFEELKVALPSKNSSLNAQILKNLPYLKACITEAFRLLPIAPNLVRISEEEMTLKGFRIPPHTLLLCQTWYNCLQEENFYRATEFIPERWMSNDNSNELEENTFVKRTRMMTHFGIGRRSCPAKKFAMLELMITLAKVFRNFNLHFPEGLRFTYEFLQFSTNVPLKLYMTQRPD